MELSEIIFIAFFGLAFIGTILYILIGMRDMDKREKRPKIEKCIVVLVISGMALGFYFALGLMNGTSSAFGY